jgi:hypothetical protein
MLIMEENSPFVKFLACLRASCLVSQHSQVLACGS